ncbi:MAG: glycosyltransferase family 4 protein [Beduini sp.]|uniref:glycosyltransferase family 4 protein n=1 Tax=Beduini sp. TaxID=1922300 RepID=UPI0039905CE8
MARILVLTNMYPSKKYPHYGVFVLNTVEILKQDGHQVKVISKPKNDSKIMRLMNYIFFYMHGILSSLFGHYDYVYGHYISHISYMVKIIHQLKPKMKIVLNAHGNDVVIEEDWMYKNKQRSAMVLPLANKIVVPSEYFKKVMIEQYQIEEDKIVLYPSGGVDLSVIHKKDPAEAKKALKLDSDTSYLGYVSRIEAHKGWEIFVKMAQLLKEQGDSRKFIMVGTGEQEKELTQLITACNLEKEIIRIPFISQAELTNVYNALDYFVFPTYRKSESLGLVGLEAMACETIMIAANNYGPTSYIQDGENGYFFESRNVLDLVCKINMVDALSVEEKQKIQQAALATAKTYETNVTAPIIRQVFK